MKQVFLFTTLTTLLAGNALAVEFNTDALKSMQDEGLRMVEESEGGRHYKAANNFCLDIAGAGLVVRKCGEGSKSQKWITDSQGRLVAHDGRCVDGARLVKCGGAKSQKWKLQDNKRLTNQNKQCLQVASHPPKGETKVTAAACNKKAAAQVWN